MNRQPEPRHFAAIFFLSLALLMLEISVARVLSVALLSHYAFVAISLAMFGIGLSSLVVYLFPDHFRAELVDRQVAAYTWRFALTAAVCVLFFTKFHVQQSLTPRGFLTLGIAYAVLSMPFLFGGVAVSLLMTHFSGAIGRIYAADLLGASLGCGAVVLALQTLPAPQVSLVVAVIGCGLAIALRAGLGGGARGWAGPILATAFVALLAHTQTRGDIYMMRFVKGWDNSFPNTYFQYEAWNAFSRVSVFDHGGSAAQTVPLKDPPLTYSGKPGFPKTLMMDIDGTAWTPLYNFDGNLDTLKFLSGSVLYLAHHLRSNADVLVIGTGGGKDLLAAQAARQKSILGLEINPLMRHMVQEKYADWSGRPYTRPGTEVIIDEARSRLAKVDRRFDILQLSLIDTFSLNAAGGVVFSENYLYTVEAFQEYFRHLKDDGMLSVSRYFVPKYPMEVLRVALMAREAWEAEGVGNFGDHVVVLYQQLSATLLIKRTPFSPDEIAALKRLAPEHGIEILYLPGSGAAGHAELTAGITTVDMSGFLAKQPFVLAAPVDDRPFFFHFLRGRLDHVPPIEDDPLEIMRQWDDALALMYMLIAVVATLATVFFLGPLLVLQRESVRELGTATTFPLLLYFACLGYGFMMIEIPLMQKFTLFLGYPVYSLAVVLFSVLLFSGLGSLLTARIDADDRQAIFRVLLTIVGLAFVCLLILAPVMRALMALPIALKIVAVVVVLAPIGLALGMAYPLGIRELRRHGEGLVPWAWGLNGAMSVVASVLAPFIGARFGFGATMITGAVAYVLAFLCMRAVTTGRRAAGALARAA